MEESTFQFTNPSLISLDFSINDGFVSSDKAVSVGLQLQTNITREKAEPKAEVKLELMVGDKSKDLPYCIRATEQAYFKWKDGLDEEQIDKLLHINAPSLLLGYLRPIIAQITESSTFGVYHIPFINFIQESVKNSKQ